MGSDGGSAEVSHGGRNEWTDAHLYIFKNGTVSSLIRDRRSAEKNRCIPTPSYLQSFEPWPYFWVTWQEVRKSNCEIVRTFVWYHRMKFQSNRPSIGGADPNSRFGTLTRNLSDCADQCLVSSWNIKTVGQVLWEIQTTEMSRMDITDPFYNVILDDLKMNPVPFLSGGNLRLTTNGMDLQSVLEMTRWMKLKMFLVNNLPWKLLWVSTTNCH